ncbi:MAG TPA: zf-TFIIB domain-containing protein [Candidatus Thermoplasmatota archaeon]|nr:zf-TFIIB domain-containing protein [Candidatus Thermoplasmatota archaeon]
MRSVPVRGPLACPRDNADLRPFRIGEVEVDTCHTCTGIWLDAGELARVALDEELEAIARAARESVASPFACPRCEGTCHPARVDDVELDACAACGGIWVDANELHDARMRMLARRAPGGKGLATLVGAVAAQRA